jgi:hypothetical protein
MKDCEKKYGIIRQSNYGKEIQKIEEFCKLLRANKVKDCRTKFLELSEASQCMFLDAGWKILTSSKNLQEISPSAYRYSFFLYKLFRGKEGKDIVTYTQYKGKELETYYKKALEWNRNLSSSSRTTSKKKSNAKDYQKYDSDILDPLYLYYSSLYSENKQSKISIIWLTENGAFEGDKRNQLVEKYKKLKPTAKAKSA